MFKSIKISNNPIYYSTRFCIEHPNIELFILEEKYGLTTLCCPICLNTFTRIVLVEKIQTVDKELEDFTRELIKSVGIPSRYFGT